MVVLVAVVNAANVDVANVWIDGVVVVGGVVVVVGWTKKKNRLIVLAEKLMKIMYF